MSEQFIAVLGQRPAQSARIDRRRSAAAAQTQHVGGIGSAGSDDAEQRWPDGQDDRKRNGLGTRGRPGGGISLSKAMTAIEPVLDRVVAELAAAHPESEIETDFEFEIPVFCDANRLARAMATDCGRSDDIA